MRQEGLDSMNKRDLVWQCGAATTTIIVEASALVWLAGWRTFLMTWKKKASCLAGLENVRDRF